MTADGGVAELRVSITVADFDRLRRFFADALGMTELTLYTPTVPVDDEDVER